VATTVLNVFTVDVEDYFQVSAFDRDVSRRDWPRFDSRVVANTRRLLDILDYHRVKATFLVLGWIAERYPRLVRSIRAAGHEIGSHGYWHRVIYRQTPK
jgi:peptidoglycan/xylan/chitin deacetylase (PgdA/CDA1 family)